MKFTADTKDLAAAVREVSKSLPRHVAWEVLSGIRVEALDGIVAVTATDLETGRRVEFEARVTEEGAAVADGRFVAAVMAAPSDETEVTGTDSLDVRSGPARWKVGTFALDDWPVEPEATGDEVELPDWSRVLQVSTFASREQARPILGVVAIGGGYIVATDSYRLAWAEWDADVEPMLVPRRAVEGLAGTPVRATSDGRRIKATTTDGAWWARLVEGSYPKWRSLLSDGAPATTAVVESERLRAALSRALVSSTVKARPVFFAFAPGHIDVQVGADGEDFTERVEAVVTGEELTVAFNGTFAADALVGDETTIEITDVLKPAGFRSGWWRSVVMPVRP